MPSNMHPEDSPSQKELDDVAAWREIQAGGSTEKEPTLEDNTPTLQAYNEGFTAYVWCDHCHMWHHHGIPPDKGLLPGTKLGHRIAHCLDYASPYSNSGYDLVLVGPLTKEVVDLHKQPAKRSKRMKNVE